MTFVLASLRPTDSAADRLWSIVLAIAMEFEGADNFVVDPTTDIGRSPLEVMEDSRVLRALGGAADAESRGLRSLGIRSALVARLATRVLQVDLYAGEEWVAGVSDWGASVALLFGDQGWRRVNEALAAENLASEVDWAEALARPRYAN